MNLFLTEDGMLKLGYYGLMTQAECYSIKKMDCDGFRGFAPVVLKDMYKMKSDVWSLGITLIEMLGIPPYDGFGNNYLPTKKGEFKLPYYKRDIESEELADFLQKCCQKKEERSSVNELLKVSVL